MLTNADCDPLLRLIKPQVGAALNDAPLPHQDCHPPCLPQRARITSPVLAATHVSNRCFQCQLLNDLIQSREAPLI